MADNVEILYVSSDNLITVEGVQNAITDSYISDATVNLMVCAEDEVLNINADVGVDKGDGKVGIPVTGHSRVSGEYIRIDGTENYNAEYAVDVTSTTNEIVVTASYVAETFTGEEKIYPSVSGTASVTLSYITASNGNYQGVLPYTAKLVDEKEYFMIISIVSGSNQVLVVSTWKAHHKT